MELKRELARQLCHLEALEPEGTKRRSDPLKRPESSEELKERIKRMEARIVDYAIRDWSKPPFGAACHAWKPGIRVPETMDELAAFRLAGQAGMQNVHICNEAYSDYQGFIEGALRSAKQALLKIDATIAFA